MASNSLFVNVIPFEVEMRHAPDNPLYRPNMGRRTATGQYQQADVMILWNVQGGHVKDVEVCLAPTLPTNRAPTKAEEDAEFRFIAWITGWTHHSGNRDPGWLGGGSNPEKVFGHFVRIGFVPGEAPDAIDEFRIIAGCTWAKDF